MNASDLVLRFIQHAIIHDRRPRYAAFVASTKNRNKFLDALDHKLASEVDRSVAKSFLNENAWSTEAVFYSSSGIFGAAFGSVREAYEKASPYGGWLIIDVSGRAAIFRPEGRIDDEMYFQI